MPVVRFPLAQIPSERNPSEGRDVELINQYPTEDENGLVHLRPRPGTSVFSSVAEDDRGLARGMYNWKGTLLAGIDDTLYRVSDSGVFHEIGTLDSIGIEVVEGDDIPEPDAFIGIVTVSDDLMVFVPHTSDYVGRYNPQTDTYTRGAAHGQPGAGFHGGVLLDDGRVVLIPDNHDLVGLYDPSSNTFTEGPATASDLHFRGGAKMPDGKVVFCPSQPDNQGDLYIGVFDPSDDSFSTIYIDEVHWSGDRPFNRAAYITTVDTYSRRGVIFVPRDSDRIMFLRDDYEVGSSFWDRGEYWDIIPYEDGSRGLLVPNGTDADVIDVTFVSFSWLYPSGGVAPGRDFGEVPENADWYTGALYQDQYIVLAPHREPTIGIVDLEQQNIILGPNIPEETDFYFRGAAVYNNKIIFARDPITTTDIPNVWYTEFAEIADIQKLAFTETDADQVMVSSRLGAILIDDDYSATEISDVDYPDQTVFGSVYQDGMMFVMTPDGEIFNSDVNDFESWNALNFIRTSFEVDEGIALVRHLNYIMAIGTRSIEFFINEGLPPPGSPLSRAENVYLPYGCPVAESIWETPERCTFIAQDPSGNYIVLSIHNTQPEQISSRYIDRFLQSSGETIRGAKGYGIRVDGQEFYVLRVGGNTFAYDFSTGYWHKWEWRGKNFPAGVGSVFWRNRHRLQRDSDGTILTVRPDLSEDEFPEEDDEEDPTLPWLRRLVRTSEFTGGSQQEGVESFRNKFLSRLELISDVNSVASDEEHIGRIRWTDDGYNTWKDWRSVDLSRHPKLTRLGRFQRRAFEVEILAPYPYRLYSLELVYSHGGYGR